MAIAISDFEALCGFVSPAEIARIAQEYPEVHLCLGERNLGGTASTSGQEEQRQELKEIFTALMTCDQTKVCLRPGNKLLFCKGE